MDVAGTGTTIALLGLLLVGAVLLRRLALRFADLEDLPTIYRRRVELQARFCRPLTVVAATFLVLGAGMSILE